MELIPFSPPKIYPELIQEVVDVLKSGWITTGPKTRQLEESLTHYCSSKATLCVSSATAGLEIILRWFGVGPGDEVIIPVYTYCATANVVLHCGAKPVMVDIGKDFNITSENIAEMITDKTKVVIPVDFAGFPCDYDQINKLVESKKKIFNFANEIQKKLGRILVLSDSAHAFGAAYKGKKIGQVTDISVFSFHAVKNLTTAEGGAITFNLPDSFDNRKIKKDLECMILNGQTKSALKKLNASSWEYDVKQLGYKYNMTDIQAAMGYVELKKYETETLPKRASICRSYIKFFKNKFWAILPEFNTVNKKSSFHLFPLRIRNIDESKRNSIIQEISLLKVSVNVHFKPLPLLTLYKNLGYKMSDYPKAYKYYSCEISLPVYYSLTDQQVSRVCEVVDYSVSQHLQK